MKQTTRQKLTFFGFYLVQYIAAGALLYYFQPFGRTSVFTQKVLYITLACIAHFPISGASHCLTDIVFNWFKPVVDPASPEADTPHTKNSSPKNPPKM